MVIRTRKHPDRYEGGAEADEQELEPVQVRRQSEILTRRMSARGTPTRSDIAVEKTPDERKSSRNGGKKLDMTSGRDASRVKVPRQPDVAEREKPLSLEVPKSKSAKGTAENTPARSINGSISGTSSVYKTRRMITRSKGMSQFWLLPYCKSCRLCRS